jgi:hypothetical protein
MSMTALRHQTRNIPPARRAGNHHLPIKSAIGAMKLTSRDRQGAGRWLDKHARRPTPIALSHIDDHHLVVRLAQRM